MENHASCEAVVGDSELLVRKRAAICNAGPAKLQVIADFDATLTKHRVNGCRGQSGQKLMVLRQKIHRLFKNVKIVSNRMVFDNNGHLVSFRGKTIHSLNKNEHALDMAAPLHDRLGDNIDAPTYKNASVKTRRNVLLLGDHIGDLGMSDGLNYENRISVGFL
ncbi:hypothetical protein Pyn_37920 [Prunus yedoensis var. nudiflora]|uniref:5'-nucleotidase n=1 Tax=Prunus yedoensis var. nudiflora TaxID=2094558 RepID=A0A314UCB5_PRUYE|nr:hypothetical protein Pyn_37920 [Prunus yedoensis var. nudiflora]